ncbi:hypothetical protein CRYUN_Cryun21dG0056800 [Craigia yunnanensis]
MSGSLSISSNSVGSDSSIDFLSGNSVASSPITTFGPTNSGSSTNTGFSMTSGVTNLGSFMAASILRSPALSQVLVFLRVPGFLVILRLLTTKITSKSTLSVSPSRLSNGRLVVDFLCDALNISTLQPYKVISANSAINLNFEVNFAISGVTSLSSDFFANHRIGDALMERHSTRFPNKNRMVQQVSRGNSL